MDISPIDLINIQSFTTRIIALNEYRSKLSIYLGEKMNQCAPNLTALIGNQVSGALNSTPYLDDLPKQLIRISHCCPSVLMDVICVIMSHYHVFIEIFC